MNGPDLRFLAERASTLEDRTRERLDEVHSRIAIARERRHVAAALGVAGLVVALVAGLAVLDRSDLRNSPAPAPKPTQTATLGTAAAPPPAQGICWMVAIKTLTASTKATSDDSRQVPCTPPHTTETVSSFALPEPTAEAATADGVTCGQTVGEYLNIDNASWINAGSVLFLPSKAEIAHGASWARCDAFIPGPWWSPADGKVKGAQTMTASMKDLADHPTDRVWTCLAKPPAVEQPQVPCDRPHAYEATGALSGLGGLSAYPSAQVLRAEAQTDCGPTVPKRLAGAQVMALWDPQERFFQGLVRGTCFTFHADGTPLPPR